MNKFDDHINRRKTNFDEIFATNRFSGRLTLDIFSCGHDFGGDFLHTISDDKKKKIMSVRNLHLEFFRAKLCLFIGHIAVMWVKLLFFSPRMLLSKKIFIDSAA